MAKTFLETVKAFLKEPKNAFESEKKTSEKDAILYGLKGMTIFAIFYAIMNIVASLITGTSFLLILLFAVIIPFITVVGQLLSALWLHLWAYIFGARQGVRNTIKVVFFGNTPTYLIGWIPLVNLAAAVWSLVLYCKGLTQLQKLSRGKAIAAVLISVIIPLVIVLIIFAWVIATFGLENLVAESTSTSLFPY